jgi:hypothetical protein
MVLCHGLSAIFPAVFMIVGLSAREYRRVRRRRIVVSYARFAGYAAVCP